MIAEPLTKVPVTVPGAAAVTNVKSTLPLLVLSNETSIRFAPISCTETPVKVAPGYTLISEIGSTAEYWIVTSVADGIPPFVEVIE